jgi:hypothetical protein
MALGDRLQPSHTQARDMRDGSQCRYSRNTSQIKTMPAIKCANVEDRTRHPSIKDSGKVRKYYAMASHSWINLIANIS